MLLITDANLDTTRAMDACAFGSSFTIATAMVAYCWGDGVTAVRTIQVARTGTVPSIVAGPTNLFTVVQAPAVAGLTCVVANAGATLAAVFIIGNVSSINCIWGATIDTSWAIVTAAFQYVNTLGPLQAASRRYCLQAGGFSFSGTGAIPLPQTSTLLSQSVRGLSHRCWR